MADARRQLSRRAHKQHRRTRLLGGGAQPFKPLGVFHHVGIDGLIEIGPVQKALVVLEDVKIAAGPPALRHQRGGIDAVRRLFGEVGPHAFFHAALQPARIQPVFPQVKFQSGPHRVISGGAQGKAPRRQQDEQQ
ncbi:hypothetical protein SDC9_130532 [bioreactor metagenome]|uniref:Uncharacterized protein n=1 Tax=bioreactor metagenome TaxID=1076179 RepID=A0A645D323_9ZZZZ